MRHRELTAAELDMSIRLCRSPDFVYLGPYDPGDTPVDSATLRRTPKYPPPPPEAKAFVNALIAKQCDGWCMWPNIWDGDMMMFRQIEPLVLPEGRNVYDDPTTSVEFAPWLSLHRKIVWLRYGRKPMVKRLQVQRDFGQLMFVCDNSRHFMPFVPCNYDGLVTHQVQVFGVLEYLTPLDRCRSRLPEPMIPEYDRIYRRDGTRKFMPDRNGTERKA